MDQDTDDPFVNHAQWYLSRLQSATADFRSAMNATGALSNFDRVWPQVRAAFEWSKEAMFVNEEAAKICVALCDCGDPASGQSPLELRRTAWELRDWAQSGIEAAHRLGWNSKEAVFHYHLASSHLSEFELEPSRSSAELARSKFEELGDERSVRVLDNVLAVIDLADNRANEAIQRLEANLATTEPNSGTSGDFAYTLSLLAMAYRMASRFEDAIGFAGKARSIAREIGDRRTELGTLRTIALARSELGDREGVIEALAEAGEVMTSSELDALTNSTFGMFDLIRIDAPDSNTSFDRLHGDLQRYRDLGNWMGEAFALAMLGLGQIWAGNCSGGHDSLLASRSIFETHGAKMGVALCDRYLTLEESLRTRGKTGRGPNK